MSEISPTPAGPSLQQEVCLYRQLLECLEEEWQALISSQEEAILALAARKKEILEGLALQQPFPGEPKPGRAELELLRLLRRQVASAQARNQRLIVASLEVIQDFLGHLNLASPGLYQSASKVEDNQAISFFHRQA